MEKESTITKELYVTAPLDDIECLWRYMKLGAFLSLLEGNAFFPSVATLKKGDRLEGDLSDGHECVLQDRLDEEFGNIQWDELRKWIYEKTPAEVRWLRETDERFADVYTCELAKRRAVWCWHRAARESAAMWAIYAEAGIAVRTSLGALKQALPPDMRFQLAEIRYSERCKTSSRDYLDPSAPGNAKWITRPHLLKGTEYSHEQELRVVTFCLPWEPGQMVCLAKPIAMIHEVVVAPTLPYTEWKVIESMVKARGIANVNRSSMLGREVRKEELKAANKAILAKVDDGLPMPFGIASKKRTKKSGHLVSCFGVRSQPETGNSGRYGCILTLFLSFG